MRKVGFSQLGNPRWGRLGNQLFQIASTMGIAHRNGYEAVFPAWSYAAYFAHSLPVGHLSNERIYMHPSLLYSPVTLSDEDCDLRGFFVSEKYFEDISESIRKQFTPSTEITTYIDQTYREVLLKNTCSIHVRRGDYLKQRWDFPTQTIDYYLYAIKQFPSDTHFVVFSDDISWCKLHFKGDRFTFIQNEPDIVDLFIMSRCQHHIISNSTFSWWGAWLNANRDKLIICPLFWFGPAISPFPMKYSRDLYPPYFTPISPPGESKWLQYLYYLSSYPILSLFLKVRSIVHQYRGATIH